MYLLFLTFSFTSICAQQCQAPTQLIAALRSQVDTQTCLKVIADPMCVPTAAIACCAYNVCPLPYPYACALGLGAGASCACLAWATEADASKFNYYSIKALAAFKTGILTLFPCMQNAKSLTKKTE